MTSNSNILSGSAMMVLLGVTILVGVWFVPAGQGTKIMVVLLGIVLTVAGGYFSKG